MRPEIAGRASSRLIHAIETLDSLRTKDIKLTYRGGRSDISLRKFIGLAWGHIDHLYVNLPQCNSNDFEELRCVFVTEVAKNRRCIGQKVSCSPMVMGALLSALKKFDVEIRLDLIQHCERPERP